MWSRTIYFRLYFPNTALGATTVYTMRHESLPQHARSPKNSLLLALSSLAVVVPVVAGFVFSGDHLLSWPELPDRHRTVVENPKPPAEPPPPAHDLTPPDDDSTSPPANPPSSTAADAAPRPMAIEAVANAIAKYWPPASAVHGSVTAFLANGAVRLVLIQGRDISPPPLDFWKATCDDPKARCVVLLPDGSTPPDARANLVPVVLDPKTSARMQSAAVAYVYDIGGKCVHAVSYRDLKRLQTEVHALLPALALAGAPVVSTIKPTINTTTTTGGERPVESSRPSLASLDSSLAPLFSTGRTSLLHIEPIRDARAHSKRVVLCFWATYCKACVAELDELGRLRAEYKDAVFVGLLDDSDMEDIRVLARKMVPDTFPTHYFLSDNVLQSKIFRSTTVPLPAFALFDSRGRLRDAFYGSLLADPKNHQRLMRHLQVEE